MRTSAGFLLLLVAAAAASATFDKALTTSLESGLRQNKVLFTMTDIAAHKRATATSETHQVLFSIAFPEHNRFALVLDRAHGRVLIETVIHGETAVRAIAARSIKPHSKVHSLLLEIDQEAPQANLYLDCKFLGIFDLPRAPKDLTENLEDLRVYRERHLDLTVDWEASVLQLLEKLGCPTDEETGSVQAQGNEVYTYRRGDIPIMHEEETSTLLVKTLSELIETIKELQVEIQTQREETALLRDALLNCEACKPGRRNNLGR